MSVFNSYARYYDLLYNDKDYEAEGKYVHTLIQKFAPDANSILELGCGTGAHAKIFAELGYRLHGVDLSTEMLARAQKRLSEIDKSHAERLSFSHGDVRSVRIGKKFDVVISLFHVISYQTSNDDLMAAFASAKSHLNAGGIFIFDCWYGPAVLTDRPAVRIKRLEDDAISVTRIAEPVMRPNDNCVDVNYQVSVTEKETGRTENIHERHSMRYLFMPEIERLLVENGIEPLHAAEWMTGREAGTDTWSVCVVGMVNG